MLNKDNQSIAFDISMLMLTKSEEYATLFQLKDAQEQLTIDGQITNVLPIVYFEDGRKYGLVLSGDHYGRFVYYKTAFHLKHEQLTKDVQHDFNQFEDRDFNYFNFIQTLNKQPVL